LSVITDLPLLTAPALRAGAGVSAWGGALRISTFGNVMQEKYPLFQSLRQLMGHLAAYRSISASGCPTCRPAVCRIEGARGVTWIAWRDPGESCFQTRPGCHPLVVSSSRPFSSLREEPWPDSSGLLFAPA
jgi:hypothetical protein